MAGDTHYEVLGVPPSADPSTMRKAYLAQARRYHPDFQSGASEEERRRAEARMRSINRAWAVLGDPTERERYDREMRMSGRASTTRGPSTYAAAPDARLTVDLEESFRGTAPPRWITVVPALALVSAFACFVVGFVTGLAEVLAAGLVLALLGAALFLVAPMVALTRSKRDDGRRGHVSRRHSRASSRPRRRRPA